MFANSREVSSPQESIHPRLEEIVRRHLASAYRREPSDAGRRAFADVVERVRGRGWILDAGCGTGASTVQLARRLDDALVVGIDKSEERLRTVRKDSIRNNVVLARCDLVDFWQLAVHEGLRCEKQFLLYPNPWPKPEHLKRRWHAHPIFPDVLANSDSIELRTNWRIYADEVATALRIAGREARIEVLNVDEPLTPFERKYAASGHALFRVISDQGTT